MKFYNVKRNFFIWTTIITICSLYSLLLALETEFLLAPMILGLCLIIGVYTFITSTEHYKYIQNHYTAFAKSLKAAYAIKLILSVLLLLTVMFNDMKLVQDNMFGIILMALDIFTGLASTWILGALGVNISVEDFFLTLILVLIDAAFMSAVILLVAWLIYMGANFFSFITRAKL